MKKMLLSIALGAISLSALSQGKDLKVAIDPTYEPFTFKTADGKPTGFDVDIASPVRADQTQMRVRRTSLGQHDPRPASQEVRRHHQLHDHQ
jgi:hypothetical protein